MSGNLYRNPALVEVICEMRWHLQPLASTPGFAIDPHFPSLEEDFGRKMASLGYHHTERLLPSDVPLEFHAGNPVIRYRTKKNVWPLFQIGPGIITVNATPPYPGWSEFKQVVKQGLKTLEQSYPLPERYLRLYSLHIRYLNGFDKRYGYKGKARFLSEDLHLEWSVPQTILDAYVDDPEAMQITSQFMFELKGSEKSIGIIKAAPGQREGQPAIILELGVREAFDTPEKLFVLDEIANWFDASQVAIERWFEAVISDRIRSAMEPVDQN